MNADYTPWKILSANLAVGVLTDGWNLATTPVPAAPEDDSPEPSARSFSVFIPFASPFQYPPVVHLGLTGFDSDQRDSSRLTVSSHGITAEGFTIQISTWSSTRLYSVELSWLAIGP